MNPKYQIFVSSTSDDMQEERLAVIMQILKKQHLPSTMEDFITAAHKNIIETIEGKIDVCDIFLLMLSGRYGYKVPKTEKSYVDFEYEYAKSKNKPIIAIVIRDDHFRNKKAEAIKEGKTFYDEDPTLYKDFLAKVKDRGEAVAFYSDINELKNHVSDAIDYYVTNKDKHGLTGLVSASESFDNVVLRLFSESTRLAQLSEYFHTGLIHNIRKEYSLMKSNKSSNIVLDLSGMIQRFTKLMNDFNFDDIYIYVYRYIKNNDEPFELFAHSKGYSEPESKYLKYVNKIMKQHEIVSLFIDNNENFWLSNPNEEPNNNIFVGTIRSKSSEIGNDLPELMGLIWVDSKGKNPHWENYKGVFFHLVATFTDSLYILLKEYEEHSFQDESKLLLV